MESDGPALLLKWKDSYPGAFTGEPSSFVRDITGDVVELADGGEEPVAGKFGLYYIDAVGSMSEGISLEDVMDHSEVTSRYHALLFDLATGELKPSVLKALEYEVLELNVLILDRLELLPKYRGMGLGLKLLCELMRRFSPGAGLVAINPFPLQFERARSGTDEDPWARAMRLHEIPGRQPAATKKLREHYARLGFKRLGSTPYMVRSTAFPLPRIEDERNDR